MTGMVMLTRGAGCGGGGGGGGDGNGGTKGGASEEEQNQLSLVALLIAALRKSMVACRVEQRDDHQNSGAAALHQMEIGWPTNVQHLTHVTFDRFHGFLGLPVEFEVEIPCRVPSARYNFVFVFINNFMFVFVGLFEFVLKKKS